MWKEIVDYRRVREGRWIKLLGTGKDGGLNVRSGWRVRAIRGRVNNND